MIEKPRIELKPVSSENPDTVRILEITRQSIERLHLYVDDFFETKKILTENQKTFEAEANAKNAEEIREKISYIESKIESITALMQRIAGEMQSLVEFQRT